jgi:hypothetical protein
MQSALFATGHIVQSRRFLKLDIGFACGAVKL